MRSFRKILLFLPLLGLLWFCRKPTTASWDVDLVLPVVSSSLNVKNFLGDSIFKSDNTGLLSLAVTRTITAVVMDSLIKLPDTTIVNSFTLPCITGCTLAPGAVLSQFPPSELTFSVGNNAAIKRADIRSGFLNVKYTNNTKQPLDLLYVIPNATKNGASLTFSETVPPLPATLTKVYDLSGYSILMTGLNGNKFNTIGTTYTMSVSNSATAIDTVYFGQGANVELSYKNIIPEYVEGYFGQQQIYIPKDTTKLDLLKSFEAKNFMLSDATLNFNITNEFGAEFTADLKNIKSINGNSVVALNSNQLSNMHINTAIRSGQTIIPSVKTISLNATNSNIVPFLSNLPEQLAYEGTVSVNPLGNISGYNNFAYYGTGIKVLADINIPLKFTADYFKLVSTAKADFSGVSQLDKVNEGKFIISASNGYPFTAQLQAYMEDDNFNIIDSLFVPGSNSIAQAVVDVNNKVVNPVNSRIEVPINRDKIENLKRCKQLKIVSVLYLAPNPPQIPIQEDYSIDINITAELNYRAERN